MRYATVNEDGQYIIIFDNEKPGTKGTFLIIYKTKNYNPPEIVILEENQYSYNIDLHIETNGQSQQPDEPITNTQPKAIAGGPYYSIVNESINFNGNKSYDSDGSITKYEWIFGDGTTNINVSPTYTYRLTGNYRVTLTVLDNEGKTDIDVTYAYVTETPNTPPTKPSIEGIASGSVNTNYIYTIKSIDVDNSSIRYSIEWGDDSNNIITDFLPNGTSFEVNHSWTYPGIFAIKAYAIDEKDVFSFDSELILLIDTIYCEDIGYITDYTGDGIYDLFHSNITLEETPVELIEGLYLIDFDNNGKYDYQFDTTTLVHNIYTQIEETKEQEADWQQMINPYLIMIIVLTIFFIIIFLFSRKTKQKKKISYTEEDKIETKNTNTQEIIINTKEKNIKSFEEEIDEILSKRK